MRLFGLLLVLALSGCGYAVPGKGDAWVGGGARVVYVELFENHTTQPYLENYLTDALVLELSRSRVIELTENPEKADVRLVGSITEFTSSAHAYGGVADRITSYRASMSASARLARNDSGEILWQAGRARTEDYVATVDKNQQLDGENFAARQVSRRLAEDFHAAMLNSF